MIVMRQNSKTRKDGDLNGSITVSYRWMMPIIATGAVILSNLRFVTSFTNTRLDYPLGNKQPQMLSSGTFGPSLTKLVPASTSLAACNSWSVQSLLTCEDAQKLMDSPQFLPSMGYGDRIVFGRQAAEKEYGKSETLGVMMSDDPRLARTYAEFPLESLDLLLDRACAYLSQETLNSDDPLTMVDIGSGLGRIVFYSALTRDSKKASWEIRGIEISQSLHNKALELAQTAIDMNIFGDSEPNISCGNSVSFHCGSATDESGKRLLEDAQLVFAYSTAFKAKEFDPDVGALILDTEEWSLPLSEACPNGCVVVTTDRALNPDLGWKMVERIDVPNPEVLGTTGFIHVLEKGGIEY